MLKAGVIALACAGFFATCGYAQAQDGAASEQTPALVRSPILTIDPNTLFSNSIYGQRVQADLNLRAEELNAENRRIEQALVAEEQSLTERRPTMDPAAFRAEAEAFDEKVQAIRRARDVKEAELEQLLESERAAFNARVLPILGDIMLERGAVVVLDSRSVYIRAGVIEITDDAIRMTDERLGDGTQTDITAQPNPADPAQTPGQSDQIER